jgi:hypothetical protein
VELEPTIENKLLLTSAGLHCQSALLPRTTQILGELSGVATNDVEFYVVSAELALRMYHLAEAQAQLETASRLQPPNQQFQLNLAVIRLGSTNPVVSGGGRLIRRSSRHDFCRMSALQMKWRIQLCIFMARYESENKNNFESRRKIQIAGNKISKTVCVSHFDLLRVASDSAINFEKVFGVLSENTLLLCLELRIFVLDSSDRSPIRASCRLGALRESSL